MYMAVHASLIYESVSIVLCMHVYMYVSTCMCVLVPKPNSVCHMYISAGVYLGN